MANNKTNYLETIIANQWLGKNAAALATTVSATLYPRLIESTATFNGETWSPTDTGECPGSTYQDRIQNKAAITNSTATWTNSTAGGAKTNKVAIVITTAAGADWGTVSRVVFATSYSTSVASNTYFYSTFTPAVIASGNTVQFATGSITYSEL